MPLTFADPDTYDLIDEDDRINVLGLPPVPGQNVRCQIVKPDGTIDPLRGCTPSATSRSSGSRPARRSTSCAARSPPARAPMDLARRSARTGSVRDFTDEPVDDALVVQHPRRRPLRARAAATASRGGSRSSRTLAIRRAAGRTDAARVGRVPRRQRAPGTTPFNVVDYRSPARARSHASNALLDNIEHVPVVLAVAADLRQIALMDATLDRPPIVRARRSTRSAGTSCSPPANAGSAA